MVGLILQSISPLCIKVNGNIRMHWIMNKALPPSCCTCNLLYLLSTHLHVQYACILIQEILILVQHCFLYSIACLLWYSNNMRTLDLKWVYFEWEREREISDNRQAFIIQRPAGMKNCISLSKRGIPFGFISLMTCRLRTYPLYRKSLRDDLLWGRLSMPESPHQIFILQSWFLEF